MSRAGESGHFIGFIPLPHEKSGDPEILLGALLLVRRRYSHRAEPPLQLSPLIDDKLIQ
jgi:hypothetical protein